MVKLLSMFAVALIPLSACGTTSGTGTSASNGAEIRAFKADDIVTQAPFDLAKHLGKDVVLVSFWATFCEPCKAEMPFLQAFHDRHAAAGLTIVSVDIDGPDTEAEVAPYVRKQGYTYPIVIDRDGSIAQALNPTSSAPYSLVIGRDGKVKKRLSGFQPAEAPALEKELEALLAEPGGS